MRTDSRLLQRKEVPQESRIDICVLGHHERGYPRNELIQRWMRAAGFGVRVVHSRWRFPFRHFHLAYQFLRIASRVKIVWITEGGHRLVPFIKLLAILARKPVIFDPFISRYNTRVEDRRLHRPGSLQAWICKWQDWSACHAADHLVFDTWEHKEYFFSHYGLKKPFDILEIGADENVFHPFASSGEEKPHHNVLFYGTYIPLQGIETILAAAEILKSQTSIRFVLLGRGQEYESIRSLADEKKLPNVTFEALQPEELRLRVAPAAAEADICLGIFGDTLKAALAVPNKVVQCAAMARPVISRRSPAMERYFKDGRDILFVPAADGEALARAILRLSNESGLRAQLGRCARETYESCFSDAALATKLRDIINRTLQT